MDVFESFFNQSIELCKQAGLVHGEAAFFDSTLKELHGLRRTRFRGRRRGQIQLWLTAAAMNIKRAVRTRARKPGPAVVPRLLAGCKLRGGQRPCLHQPSPRRRTLQQQPPLMACARPAVRSSVLRR